MVKTALTWLLWCYPFLISPSFRHICSPQVCFLKKKSDVRMVGTLILYNGCHLGLWSDGSFSPSYESLRLSRYFKLQSDFLGNTHPREGVVFSVPLSTAVQVMCQAISKPILMLSLSCPQQSAICSFKEVAWINRQTQEN